MKPEAGRLAKAARACYEPPLPHSCTKASLLNTDTAAPPADTAEIDAEDLDAGALVNLILAKLDDDKAEDVVAIDLNGSSPLADWIVIASGRSHRHVAALADHLQRALKDAGYGRVRAEGLPQADWVLIDAGDVIVHLFRPEVRAFYQIEKIWSVDSPHRGLASN